jgi:hypothetical protein
VFSSKTLFSWVIRYVVIWLNKYVIAKFLCSFGWQKSLCRIRSVLVGFLYMPNVNVMIVRDIYVTETCSVIKIDFCCGDGWSNHFIPFVIQKRMHTMKINCCIVNYENVTNDGTPAGQNENQPRKDGNPDGHSRW